MPAVLAPVAVALGAAGLLLAAWAVLQAALDRRVSGAQLLGCAVLEVALVGQAVGGVVALAVTDRPVEPVTFVGYQLTLVLMLPLGVFWAIAERSRWGNGVLAVACAVVPVLLVRLGQIWAGA